ncbi:MAG: DUF3237 domain-containing protein [Alphaproteobacteria bacterium]
MIELKSEFLFTMTIVVEKMHMIGEAPIGRRRMDCFAGGSIEGPKVKGVILPGGNDTLIGRRDGALLPNVRLLIRTDDDALIYCDYRGIRCGPQEVMDAIARGEQVEPDSYYLRNTPMFETESKKYDWLNRVVAVGVGRRTPNSAIYEVFHIL